MTEINHSLYRGFLFDLDGTLTDSVPIIMETLRYMFDHFGIIATDDELRATIGVPLIETGERWLGLGRGPEFVEGFSGNYFGRDRDLQAFPGIIDLLDELRRNNARISLVTSKRQDAAQRALATSGIGPYLNAVVCCESTERHKPLPDPALLAAAKLDLEPSQCVFIGDSVHDMSCGKTAGMVTCGVTWGVDGETTLIAAGADYVAKNVAELHNILMHFLTPGE